MSRAPGGDVELTEYPLFDTLLNGVGISALSQSTQLFAGLTQGRPQYTNMQQGSQIPSGGIYLIRSLRGASFFQSLFDTEYTVAYGSIAAQTAPTSTTARMYDCYNQLAYGSQITFAIAQKPMIIIPWWWIPAGGGTFGSTNATGRTVVTNGMPSKEAVGGFTKPLKIDSLQAFTCTVQFYSFSKNSVAGGFTGSGQSTTFSADLSPLDFLNQADGAKYAAIFLGGVISRDIT